MLGAIDTRGCQPSHHREPELIDLGVVRVPPTLQDAFKP